MSVHAAEDKKTLTCESEVDPNKREHEYEVDLGGIIKLVLKADGFDLFEITFEKPGPPPGVHKKLIGTIKEPVSIPMPHAEKTYKGHIVFKKKDGGETGALPFLAKSCPACGK